ncbi:hypothetical protein Pla108_14650 [Botrimarina colliarenosi]|uniref:Uncharacterized protein n=1 Tax=Botrimarina colliarenosi TaxID=2528001 RepID=A0A5C6AKF4_9BACT|nr:hypothetical protein [Botrimarina colliarenosi]TWU00513.1 hypothetical protein Pla108_14650 [Botrimarina colliarenosi]
MPAPSDTPPTEESFEHAMASQVVGDEPNVEAELSAKAIESSTPFVGQWNQLVSTTNWDKGQIITAWREALRKSGAHVTEYSDEAWTRLVGNVTSQHVGRLRRAHERFGAVREQYAGLYWSHFQAALDWEDAEMWLEGAISNKWSVSQMRAGRWEATGGGPEGPSDGRVIETQLDEDAYQSLSSRETETTDGAKPAASGDGDATAASTARESSPQHDDDSEAPFDVPGESAGERAPRVRPFADLAALPDDVADAFEQFKLVILSHKLSGWDAISRDDLLGALESLKALALAPSDDQ